MASPPRKPVFFASPKGFRGWLAKNHAKASELWVGFHKRHTGKPSLTWPESVDAALCFGWTDGLHRSLGEDAYAIRFSPRRASSIWSDVNTKRIRGLIAAGRVTPAGLVAFKARDSKRAGVYSFEKPASLDAGALRTFRASAGAWRFFAAQPPGYRRVAGHWVGSAKREDTRERRLAKLIDVSARGARLASLAKPAKVTKRRASDRASRGRPRAPRSGRRARAGRAPSRARAG